MENQFWNFGEKSRLAKTVGIRQHHLSEIITGERGLSVKMARKLEAASIAVLGLRRAIPASCWLGLDEHPALVRGKLEEVEA